MVSTSYTFRLDPFAADYDAAIQLSEAEEPSASVDVTVERADWEPVRPQASPNPARLLENAAAAFAIGPSHAPF